MARQQKNGFAKFDINSSEAMQNIEDIYDSESPAKQITAKEDIPAVELKPVEETAPEVQRAAQKPLSPKGGTSVGLKPLRADKGVKIQLPMDYYFKLVQIKACTGKSLQDLAAQGVMEFIDRFDPNRQVNEKSDL